MGLNKEAAVKKITDSEDESFEVFTEPEHTTYLDNYAKTEVEKRIGTEISRVHSQYDDDIFEITRERKDGSEKTYDFIKRKVKALKELSGNSETLKSQIKQLEEDLKNKSGDEQLKKDYEQLKTDYNTDKETWNKKTQEHLTSQETMKVELQLDHAASRLKYKEDIPESLRSLAVQNAKNNLLKAGKIVDGKLIFLDDKGVTRTNKDNALNPYTAEELLTIELKDVIGEKKVITGTGVKPEIVKVDGEETINVSMPDSVRYKEDVSHELKRQGLDRNSKEYSMAYAKYSKDLPHRP